MSRLSSFVKIIFEDIFADKRYCYPALAGNAVFNGKEDNSKVTKEFKRTDGRHGTIAYRMAVLNPQFGFDVIVKTSGVILIDEVDLHLHPAWQHRILGDFKEIFPRVQFIVITHVPAVISSAKSDNLVILKDYEVLGANAEIYGNDVNSILKDIMGVSERNPVIADLFSQFKDPGISGTTIEHFIPVEPKDGRNVGQALDYHNLFAVCHGQVKRRMKGMRRARTTDDLTCDKHRKNTEFRKINPCKKETLQTIFYTPDGSIDASDPDVRFDLVNTLNLNCASAPLIAERRATLDALIDEIGKVEEKDLHIYCTELLNAFLDERDPKTPYVGILIWYLKTIVQQLA